MSNLPQFKPTNLGVNQPTTIRIDSFGKEFTKDFGKGETTSVLTEIVYEGKQHVWFINKKTIDYNKHIIYEGADLVVVRTLTDKGKTRIIYSAPGDVSTLPQNVPQGQAPQRNTREIKKLDEQINPARVGFSWNFAKDMLLAQKQGTWKDLKKELYVLASEIYYDPDVIKSFEKGFIKIAEKTVAEAEDRLLDDFPWDEDSNPKQ